MVLALLTGSVRDGDLGGPRLAEQFTRPGLEALRNRHAIFGMETDDLELDLQPIEASRHGSHDIRHDIRRHGHQVGLRTPRPAQLLGLGMSASRGADVLSLVIGVEHHDPHFITIGGVGLDREVEAHGS